MNTETLTIFCNKRLGKQIAKLFSNMKWHDNKDYCVVTEQENYFMLDFPPERVDSPCLPYKIITKSLPKRFLNFYIERINDGNFTYEITKIYHNKATKSDLIDISSGNLERDPKIKISFPIRFSKAEIKEK